MALSIKKKKNFVIHLTQSIRSRYHELVLFVLIYKPGETIQLPALFFHGTQVAMLSQKCRAGISISKTGMGRDPKRKKHKAKHHEDCNPIKECGKKTGAEGELQELKNQARPTMPPPTPLLKDRNASPHNLRVFDKTHKRKGQTNQFPRQRRERDSKRASASYFLRKTGGFREPFEAILSKYVTQLLQSLVMIFLFLNWGKH